MIAYQSHILIYEVIPVKLATTRNRVLLGGAVALALLGTTLASVAQAAPQNTTAWVKGTVNPVTTPVDSNSKPYRYDFEVTGFCSRKTKFPYMQFVGFKYQEIGKKTVRFQKFENRSPLLEVKSGGKLVGVKMTQKYSFTPPHNKNPKKYLVEGYVQCMNKSNKTIVRTSVLLHKTTEKSVSTLRW